MEVFFIKHFFQKNKKLIVWFSFLRIIDFLLILFWPYAFAKMVNIISNDPNDWRLALWWAIPMIIVQISEDFIRLLGKLGLSNIANKLKIELATFFSEKTEIKNGKRTGEAVQTVRRASDAIENLVNYYKDKMLQLPVNLIVIPIILFSANPQYLIFLIVYIGLYLLIEYFAVRNFQKKTKQYFNSAEAFWGTTYRRTPDVWRQREDGFEFIQEIEEQGELMYKDGVATNKTNHWRWIWIQALSSVSIGGAILFVIYKIVLGTTHVGDLILVSSYFAMTQESLNIISDAFTNLIQTKIALERLDEAVGIKDKNNC